MKNFLKGKKMMAAGLAAGYSEDGVKKRIPKLLDRLAKEIEEEVYEVPDAGQQATTSLGSLFANIKLD